MAWTDQCKIAFKVTALGKLAGYKNKGRKVTGVLKEISRESDIPFNTLKQWYYEKEGNDTLPENKEDDNPISMKNHTDKCFRCEKNTVYIDHRSKKPLSEQSKYHGLCGTCRRDQQYVEALDRQSNENKDGFLTMCPHCEKPHYVNIDGVNDYRRK